ncbi:hypothetical protein [Aquisalimonas sp.]|uniref:hypothetical protein n=1 Tax=Aquisalimonas sp. TaxID=1872621 RepID=UPI0025C1E87B|nr:hypothetical protein [Aquisalimonas sp.]
MPARLAEVNEEASELIFERIHIDVARNASDDFNPFHDSSKWSRIQGNPFGGPIALGFQLECLMEYLVSIQRDQDGLEAPGTGFRNYQFTFADVLHPGEPFSPRVHPARRTTDRNGRPLLSNRITVRKREGLILLGNVRDSDTPQCAVAEQGLALLGVMPADIRAAKDRSTIPGTGFFLKRKYLMNGNAKNLISASLADQNWYFDEIERRINFPDMVPASLISCALLERADAVGHDFYTDPMVYAAHHISVDQGRARRLRSNDMLHILVDDPVEVAQAEGLRGAKLVQQRHRCLGILSDGSTLFGAEVLLAPLRSIHLRGGESC